LEHRHLGLEVTLMILVCSSTPMAVAVAEEDCQNWEVGAEAAVVLAGHSSLAVVAVLQSVLIRLIRSRLLACRM
jgi:hypothetical protein